MPLAYHYGILQYMYWIHMGPKSPLDLDLQALLAAVAAAREHCRRVLLLPIRLGKRQVG